MNFVITAFFFVSKQKTNMALPLQPFHIGHTVSKINAALAQQADILNDRTLTPAERRHAFKVWSAMCRLRARLVDMLRKALPYAQADVSELVANDSAALHKALYTLSAQLSAMLDTNVTNGFLDLPVEERIYHCKLYDEIDKLYGLIRSAYCIALTYEGYGLPSRWAVSFETLSPAKNA